jgi:hypothetical protein
MNWYTVYRTDDNALMGHGTVIPDPLPENLSVIEHGERQDQGKVWEPASLSWVVPAASREVSVRRLYRELTTNERMKLAQTHTDGGNSLRWFFLMESLVSEDVLDKDSTGADQILGMLASEGIIAEDRIFELLS